MEHSTDFLLAQTRLRLTGHDFDDEKKLREFDIPQLESKQTAFRFDVFNGDWKSNQERYEKVGDAVAAYVQALLVSPSFGMEKFQHFYGSVSSHLQGHFL